MTSEQRWADGPASSELPTAAHRNSLCEEMQKQGQSMDAPVVQSRHVGGLATLSSRLPGCKIIYNTVEKVITQKAWRSSDLVKRQTI